VVSPNGKTAYAVSPGGFRGPGTVTPINTSSNAAGRPITVGMRPFAMAITPNGRTAYVVNALSRTVTPFQTATGKTGKAIKVGLDPEGILITPDGRTAYVANLNSVTPIRLATRTPGRKIEIEGFPPTILELVFS